MSVLVEGEQEDGRALGSVPTVLLVGKPEDGETPTAEAFHDLDEQDEMCVGMMLAKPTSGRENDKLTDR